MTIDLTSDLGRDRLADLRYAILHLQMVDDLLSQPTPQPSIGLLTTHAELAATEAERVHRWLASHLPN